MRIPKLAAVMALTASCCFAQARFPSGELKGFTISPTEHIVVEMEQPFEVRSVEGVILRKVNGLPLEGVIFEIRGPGSSERIRGTKSDSRGRFRMKGVPQGTYMFKATLDGFQSVVGTIIVSKDADKRNCIKIEMPLGV